MAAARAAARAAGTSLKAPGAVSSSGEQDKPIKEKSIRKIRVSDAALAANGDVPREELLAKAVSQASRLFDRRIKKKLNRGDIDDAIAYVQKSPVNLECKSKKKSHLGRL